MVEGTRIPLLEHDPSETPVFTAANLLEAARIRKGLPKVAVPAGCLLDFDGELVQHLAGEGRAVEDSAWPCFHTRLFRWREGSAEYGVIGGAIGAPFAVLVAEELFALGCRALVSISSAGLVDDRFTPPFFLLVDKALRDEGTSCHYMRPSRYADADPRWSQRSGTGRPDCPSRTYRHVVDHGCALPGDEESHRIAPSGGDRLRRNGGRRASDPREGPEQNRRVPRPHYQYDGDPGGGFRERRGRGNCGFPFRAAPRPSKPPWNMRPGGGPRRDVLMGER